jgi:hypothetical protein
MQPKTIARCLIWNKLEIYTLSGVLLKQHLYKTIAIVRLNKIDGSMCSASEKCKNNTGFSSNFFCFVSFSIITTRGPQSLPEFSCKCLFTCECDVYFNSNSREGQESLFAKWKQIECFICFARACRRQ